MPRNIDALIWRAFTDCTFRQGLMDDRRQELVETLGLTEEEREAVLAVEADSLEAFAGALYECCVEPDFMAGCNVA